MSKDTLNFRTSSGIKSIVGRDLITDKFVAIFELVKNSYDANAKNVIVSFNNLEHQNKEDLLDQDQTASLYELGEYEPHLIIRDDGKGMSKDDLQNKWLFLAYSEKKDKEGTKNKGRNFVGSKGVGRFSCDTLGGRLILKTKESNENIEHQLFVNWSQFEENQTIEFSDIEVEYQSIENKSNEQYTELIIRDLRHQDWHSDSEQGKTKKALEKLKNPFKTDDGFNIFIGTNLNPKKLSNKDRVINDISNIIKGYTTTIEVIIDKTIEYVLYDRGELIFKLEKENHTVLKNTPIIISIHYLNPTAKRFFTQAMGIQPLNYGTIFIYKNGFRVMPYGDDSIDLFGLNLRKTQGYSRFLGTRELLGYFEIQDQNNYFKEASSRNNGFIQNSYFNALETFYMKEVHRILEKYIHLIQWGENAETETEIFFNPQHSELDTFKKYITSKGYEINFFKDEIEADIKNNNPEKKLDKLISQTIDEEIKIIAVEARDQLKSLKEDTKKQEQKISQKSQEIKQLQNQNKNLSVSRTQNSYSEQISHHFTSMSERLRFSTEKLMPILKKLPEDDFKNALKELNKIRKTQNELDMFRSLLLKTNHDMRSKQTINWYTEADWFTKEKKENPGAIQISCSIENMSYLKNWEISSNILDFQMALENLYQNAREHGATYIDFTFYKDHISVNNNSSPILESDIDKIKELGYSTKATGTGIGCYQIDQFFKRHKFAFNIEQETNLVSFIFTKEG